jgi:hypothetical protein
VFGIAWTLKLEMKFAIRDTTVEVSQS